MTNIYLYLGMFVFWAGLLSGIVVGSIKLFWLLQDYYRNYSLLWECVLVFNFWRKYIIKKDTPYIRENVVKVLASFDNPRTKDYKSRFKKFWKRELNVLLQRDEMTERNILKEGDL